MIDNKKEKEKEEKEEKRKRKKKSEWLKVGQKKGRKGKD